MIGEKKATWRTRELYNPCSKPIIKMDRQGIKFTEPVRYLGLHLYMWDGAYEKA